MANDRYRLDIKSDDSRGATFKCTDTGTDGTKNNNGNIDFDSSVNFHEGAVGIGKFFKNISASGLQNDKFSPLSGFTHNLALNNLPNTANIVIMRVNSKNSSLWSDAYVQVKYDINTAYHSFFYQKGTSDQNRPRHQMATQILVPVIKNSSGTRGIYLKWSNMNTFYILGCL